MKSIISICIFVLSLTVVRAASAQGFVVIDAAKNSFGVEGGALFGEDFLVGFAVGAFHPYEFKAPTIDTEAYSTLGMRFDDDWLFLANVGGGLTYDEDGLSASARSILVFTQTFPVAFRTQVFTMWTPNNGSAFIQERTGVSVRLGDTDFRLFPHLALNLNSPGGGHAVEVSASPGCAFFASF